MKESIREKQILNSLCAGQPITVNSRVYNLDNDEARKLLAYIRTLPSDIIKPPFGKDKVVEFINNYKNFLEINKELTISFSPSYSGENFRKLKLKRVTTYNFRGLQYYNSSEFSFQFDRSSYLITGFNGSGKSSFLNAIVWAITGQLLWDRTVPEPPQKVEIKQLANSESEILSLIKEWPSHVTLPNARQITENNVPVCWVEVELVDENTNDSILIRRKSRGNREEVTGVESLDPLSVDLSLIMPGRVSHVKIDQNAELGKLFFQVSGLDILNDYGIFVSSNGISKTLSAHLNDLKKSIEEKKIRLQKETDEFNRILPEDIKDDYRKIGNDIQDLITRAECKIQWLERQASYRLSQLSNVLNLDGQLSDEQLSSIGRKIMVAYETIKSKPPTEWRAFRNLKMAMSDWNDEAQKKWADTQDAIKRDLNTALEWYKKQKEASNLKLKLVASKLVSHTSFLDKCPLCEMKLPHDHPLRKELVELKQVEDLAIKSIEEVIFNLQKRLINSLPNSFQRVDEFSSLNAIASSAFNEEFGNILDGDLITFKRVGLESINLLKDDSKIMSDYANDIFITTNDEWQYESNIKELLEAFEREFDSYAKKVIFISNVQKYFSDYINSLNEALGFGQSSGEETFLQSLIRANNIAESAKPIQDAIEKLKLILTLLIEREELTNQYNFACRVKNSLKEVELIRNLADELLVEDLNHIEDELKYYYKKLYDNEEFTLKRVLTNKSGRNLVLQFWVQYGDVLVEASPFLNSSRIRALLWSYVFALSKVASKNPRGDWLNFTLIDEPLTSLDQEHQRSFAEIVFDSNSSHQYIVASHDLRWPREIQNLSSVLGLKTLCVSCYGLSSIRSKVVITEWKSQLEKLWRKWSEERDIETGRDYVQHCRIWCEEELKEVLIWASDPPTETTNLSPLITKLENAIKNDSLYKIDGMDKLIDTLKEIEDILQNSHHGSVYRNTIHQNDINRVEKKMRNDIIPNISRLKDNIYYRLGRVNII